MELVFFNIQGELLCQRVVQYQGYRMVYEKMMHLGKYQPSLEISAF